MGPNAIYLFVLFLILLVLVISMPSIVTYLAHRRDEKLKAERKNNLERRVNRDRYPYDG